MAPRLCQSVRKCSAKLCVRVSGYSVAVDVVSPAISFASAAGRGCHQQQQLRCECFDIVRCCWRRGGLRAVQMGVLIQSAGAC